MIRKAGTLIIVCSFILFLLIPGPIQAVSRSSGIGMQIGFWNITNHPTRISQSNYGQNANVDISGFGTWINFFSRAHLNWFFEFQMGAIGGAHVEVEKSIVGKTEAQAIIPLLFGLRYDIMSNRLPGTIHPYISAGGGPYWIALVKSDGPFENESQEISTDTKFGAYAGTGANIMLMDWFGLNFNIRYHFVDLKFEEEYSGLEIGLGLNFMWGSQNEIFEVKDIQLVVNDIYPAYYQFYNTYPIALVKVRNVAGYSIEVNLKSNLEPYSERPGNSGYKRIAHGETLAIPVTVIFGKRIQEISMREPAVLDIEVEARANKIHKQRLSAPIVIHNVNAWNGDVDKLSFYITPDEPDIINGSRNITENLKGFETDPLLHFKQARYVFNYFTQSGITYHRDPNIPYYKDDRVQYAMETIETGRGDCDDLVVLYSSFLESLGIKSAFVEVIDPEEELAHLFLIFDTDIPADQGYLLSSNEKRYIIREKDNGTKTVWIPVETTLVSSGFENAWKAGALQYLKDGLVKNGIIDGWMKIIDVD